MAKSKSLPREASRTKIPMPVQLSLLMEAGYKCGNPGCRNILVLHLHHMQYVSEGGGDEAENLLVLCALCHGLHHRGDIPVEAVRHWKGMLLALNNAFDRSSLDLLLLLRKTENAEVWYSGDALLRFAGLISSGLVGFTTQKLQGQTPTTSGTMYGMPTTFHGSYYDIGMIVELKLTEKGRLLVDAWVAGDEGKFRALVGAPTANPSEDEGSVSEAKADSAERK